MVLLQLSVQYIGAANILLNQCAASSPALPVSETRDEEGRKECHASRHNAGQTVRRYAFARNVFALICLQAFCAPLNRIAMFVSSWYAISSCALAFW
jgi:hypothetical protein